MPTQKHTALPSVHFPQVSQACNHPPASIGSPQIHMHLSECSQSYAHYTCVHLKDHHVSTHSPSLASGTPVPAFAVTSILMWNLPNHQIFSFLLIGFFREYCMNGVSAVCLGKSCVFVQHRRPPKWLPYSVVPFIAEMYAMSRHSTVSSFATEEHWVGLEFLLNRNNYV